VEFFRSDDPEDLARAIRDVQGRPERRREMVERASALYAQYRWPQQREIYRRAVERLAGRKDDLPETD
jgi:hypothetical protein